MSKLYSLATKLLAEHKTIDAAIKPLVAAVVADPALLEQLARIYLSNLQRATPARQRSGLHRRPAHRRRAKLPTAAQSKAAVKGAKAIARSILDTRRLRGGPVIGDVRFQELQRRAQTAVLTGADFLLRGTEDIVDAYACKMLSQRAVPASSDARVRDVFKASDVEKVYVKARQQAALRIAEETRRVADNLLREPEPPPALPAA